MNYTFIILGIVLVVVLYILYTTLIAPSSIVSTQTYLKSNPPSVGLSTLTNSNSMNYYYSLWIYVNNLSQGSTTGSSNTSGGFPNQLGTEANNIFYIVDSSNQPYVSLDVKTSTELNTSLMVDNMLKTYVITPNFALQRWEHVIISISQTYLDLYLDGKLIKSISLPSVPNTPDPLKKPTIYFGNGDIYIAGFQRKPDPMDPQTAWNIYLTGSGVTQSPINYGLSMTLSKNNKPKSTITLF